MPARTLNGMKSAISCIAVAALGLALAAPGAASADDQLPDLGMAPLKDFKVEKTAAGKRLLRYTAIVVNIGKGPFQVRGDRASAGDSEMSVVQQIHDHTGATGNVPTTARMYFAGDGHSHWHVRDLEESVLERLDNGAKVGSGAKHGFCFYDNVAFRTSLLGAPSSPFYRTCGTSGTVTTQSMGLSVGWGDSYPYTIVDQWVDITNVSPGRYRLHTTADAQNWFAEANEFNNATYVDLQIKNQGAVRVIGYGPAI